MMRTLSIDYNLMLFIGLFVFTLPVFFSSAVTAQPPLKKAIFAGGCFWCMEKPFEEMEGVVSVTSGYIGGDLENPTYENYAKGGHIESIEIVYNPEKISYSSLLDIFWRQVNPTDAGGQFVDRGKAILPPFFTLIRNKKPLLRLQRRR